MKPIRIILFIAAFFITLGVLWYTDNKNYYKPGEKDTFNVKVGETFVIKLDENGSARRVNCWTSPMHTIILKDQKFKAYSDRDGAGGLTSFTFLAVAKGIDTMRVNMCPILPEAADYNPGPGNVFVVKVTEN